MYSFDASSMIHAWDNYPPSNSLFDSLWKWIAEQINDGQFIISKTAMEKVRHKIQECGAWLTTKQIKTRPMTASALSAAKKIKKILGIEEEK